VLFSWKYLSEDGTLSVVIKRWTWSATILRLAVAFKLCSTGKYSPHHFSTSSLIQGRMDPCFHVVYTKLPSERRCRNPASVSSSYLTGVSAVCVFCCWSSSASRFNKVCVFRDALLHLGCKLG